LVDKPLPKFDDDSVVRDIARGSGENYDKVLQIYDAGTFRQLQDPPDALVRLVEVLGLDETGVRELKDEVNAVTYRPNPFSDRHWDRAAKAGRANRFMEYMFPELPGRLR
jgi:hypothetical protein